MTKPTLGYWDIRGVVQPIRFLLHYIGVDYEEKLYDTTIPTFKEEWLKDKFALGLDFPDLPYWIDGDVKLTESRVILREIAKKYASKLVPTTSDLQLKLDMLENFISDIQTMVSFYCYFMADAGEASDGMFRERLCAKLQVMSNFVGSKTWSLGEQITYVDFIVYEQLMRIRKLKPKFLESFPNLGQLLDRFEALPEIAKYRDSPSYISGPAYMRFAKVDPLR